MSANAAFASSDTAATSSFFWIVEISAEVSFMSGPDQSLRAAALPDFARASVLLMFSCVIPRQRSASAACCIARVVRTVSDCAWVNARTPTTAIETTSASTTQKPSVSRRANLNESSRSANFFSAVARTSALLRGTVARGHEFSGSRSVPGWRRLLP